MRNTRQQDASRAGRVVNALEHLKSGDNNDDEESYDVIYTHHKTDFIVDNGTRIPSLVKYSNLPPHYIIGEKRYARIPQWKKNHPNDLVDKLHKYRRAQSIRRIIGEAYYSSYERPNVRDYTDLIHQVSELLSADIHDTRPVLMLYAYFVKSGSDRMDKTLQDLGHHLVDNYGFPFEHAEQVLNTVVRRLSAIGRMRSMQRYNGGSGQQQQYYYRQEPHNPAYNLGSRA